jgi:hypothetical protein
MRILINFVLWQVTPEKLKARQVAKARAWEAEMGKACEVLRPVCIGCCWWTPDEMESLRGDLNLELLSRFTVRSLFPVLGILLFVISFRSSWLIKRHRLF